jgi:hypothetical protein
MRRTTIAVAFLSFGIQAHAGIITQTSNFHYADHGGTGAQPYNQLDPSLTPLNAVVFSISIAGYPVSFGHTFEVSNPTSNTISFNATLSGGLFTEAGGFTTMPTVPTTLGPHQSKDFIPLIVPSPAFQSSMTQTTNLDRYVGTGMVVPAGFGGFERVTADNSLITVTQLGATAEFLGSETITYYYGSSFPVPEPASLAMLSFGLPTIAMLMLAWRKRRARLAV